MSRNATPAPRRGRFDHVWALAVLLTLAAHAAIAQPAAPSSTATQDAPARTTPQAAPLVLQGDTIIVFRSVVAGAIPERRAAIARDRIEAFGHSQLMQPVRTEPLESQDLVLVGDVLAFFVVEGDSLRGAGSMPDAVAPAAAARLGAALRACARMLAPGQRLRSLIAALVATLVLLVLLRLLGWVHRIVDRWIESKHQIHHGKLRLGNLDLVAQFSLAATWIVRIALQLSAVVLTVLWIIYVLNRFPETERFGIAARATIVSILRLCESRALGAIPGLIAVTLIVILARFASKLASDLFEGIERGAVHVAAVHPETAGATRRLVVTMIWLFAVVVAYPLIPGSGSEAFKGVSVFLGLLITLGSSGVVGHLMSGLVLVYSRALRPGDFVRVTDIEGKVTEVGALSVKMVNALKEEFTIPNTVMVGNVVKNYSRLDREFGSALSTSVTIGYDAPWRVVYELLLAAAERTPGVRKSPAPVVFQPMLSDFFVEYRLTVRHDDAFNRFETLSQLHQNIQDAFNERGVQIMSPHFEGQPDHPVLVPKERWSNAAQGGGSAASPRD